MKPTWMLIALTAAILCVSCTRAENSSTLAPAGDQNTESPEVTPESVDETTSDEPETTASSTEAGQSTLSTESPAETSTETVTVVSTGSPTNKSTSVAPEATTEGESDTTVTAGTTTAAPPKCGRKFDAWSFIGGMILVGGIVIISFIVWKYYKSKTEARYHQF